MPLQGKAPDWDRVENAIFGILNSARLALLLEPEAELQASRATLRALDLVAGEQFGHPLKLNHGPEHIAALLQSRLTGLDQVAKDEIRNLHAKFDALSEALVGHGDPRAVSALLDLCGALPAHPDEEESGGVVLDTRTAEPVQDGSVDP